MKGKNKVFLMIISIILFFALVTTIILGQIKFHRYISCGDNKMGSLGKFI